MRIALVATVADARVEQAVGADLQLAAVVVRRGAVLDAQELMSGRDVGAVGVRTGRLELLDADVAVATGEVDVEQVRLRVVARERHREQAALAAGVDVLVDVEEG